MEINRDQEMNKAIMFLFALALFVYPHLVESQNQAGMNYWNGVKKQTFETESGLKYKILHKGSGRKPNSGRTVTVHYRGLLLNGVVFDSSYNDDEPIKMSLRSVIKGWKEGIPLMPEGSVFLFLIPPELAYGEKGTDGIPPNSTLIFEVELYAN
jgi:FKBP-type peptidyl-prolyl cis-trans isomerase